MLSLRAPVVLLAVLPALILAVERAHPDLISSMPGLSPHPTFRQYSGYLRASSTNRLHYWFVESQARPASDPLVLWLNGGPGCSSVDGFLTENGPFRVNEDGETLAYNTHSWNKFANVLYLETPAGVGFSYDTESKYNTDDDKVASANLNALKEFFVKFPSYKGREFYITGESYAGIYIPTLMRDIDNDGSINLKGALIGNGYFVPVLLTNTKIHYWYYHGIIGTDLWSRMLQSCCIDQVSDECQFLPFKTARCRDILTEAMITVNDIPFNPYNIYDDCRGQMLSNRKHETVSRIAGLLRQLNTDLETDNKQFLETFVQQSEREKHAAPCMDDKATSAYLNSRTVRHALHIAGNTGLPPWTTCSPLIDDAAPVSTYTRVYDDMRPILKTLVSKYRMWIFNGDLDTICDFLGDEEITDSLEIKEIRPHQPWYITDELGQRQIAGFSRAFDYDFTFLTVKGAGHMVPTDQPEAALEMLRRFLNDERNGTSSSSNSDAFIPPYQCN